MATKYVKDIDRGYKALMMEIDNADDVFVDVGIFEGERNEETKTTISEYATVNEFGDGKIPSRPFMAISFDENVARIEKDMEIAARRIVGGTSSAMKEFNIIGLKHQQRIQRTIKGRDILPKLADSTIAEKGSTKTLVDTGIMVNAVTYTIRYRYVS